MEPPFQNPLFTVQDCKKRFATTGLNFPANGPWHLLLFQFICVSNGIKFTHARYGNYDYPDWADALGWILGFTPVMCVPGYMIYHLVRTRPRKVRDASRAGWGKLTIMTLFLLTQVGRAGSVRTSKGNTKRRMIRVIQWLSHSDK